MQAKSQRIAFPNGETVELRERVIDGASLLYASGPPPSEEGVHTHAKARLSFLVAGEIAETDDRNKTVGRGPLSARFTPAHLPHGHRFLSRHLECICLELDLASLQSLDSDALDRSMTIANGAVTQVLPRLQREIFREDTASDLVLTGLIYEFFGEFLRSREPLSPKPPFWLKRAQEMLSDQWQDSVRIEDVAAEVGVHPSHLLRVFRQHLGTTPGAYLRKLRLDHATHQVLADDTPMKVIASTAGYADQAHFSRAFKKEHGVTPEQMRRTVR